MIITKTETGYQAAQRAPSTARYSAGIETTESDTAAGAIYALGLRLARYRGMTWPKLGHEFRPGCHCPRPHEDFLCDSYLSIDGYPVQCLAKKSAH